MEMMTSKNGSIWAILGKSWLWGQTSAHHQKFDIAHYFPMSAWLILMSRSHKNDPKRLYWYKIQHGMDM